MNSAPEVNQILSYRDMCDIENQQLQRGMNFDAGGAYSIILMSVKKNAPYEDRISGDGLTVYYEGHDVPGDRSKAENQPEHYPGGGLTQNGLFKSAINHGKRTKKYPLARVYEKLQMGIWTYRGLFEMRDYDYKDRSGRKVFEFTLTITDQKRLDTPRQFIDIEQTRQIPGKVKLEVYKRDKAQCVKCGAKDNLHFDHILPYSLGGTSVKVENIQLLCARHNLEKSNSLEK